MSDALGKLLRAADQRHAVPAIVPPGLSSQVWKTARGRSRRFIAASAVAIAGISAIGFLMVLHQPRVAPPITVARVIPALPEKSDLDARIAAQEKLVSHLESLDRLKRANTRLAQLQSESSIDPLDQAAAVLVLEADRLRDAGLLAQAAFTYQQVLQYFPATSWARPVQQRLDSLEIKG